MTQEFIPYEQALELKELGFDEECLGWYPKDTAALSLHGVFIGKPSSGSYKLLAYAPLYQQAFRWFREKYNIQSCIKFTHAEYSFEIHFEKLANGEPNPIMVGHFVDSWLGLNLPLFKTYEEGEVACLKKLIEIIKNK
jgi:hypothetical protein